MNTEEYKELDLEYGKALEREDYKTARELNDEIYAVNSECYMAVIELRKRLRFAKDLGLLDEEKFQKSLGELNSYLFYGRKLLEILMERGMGIIEEQIKQEQEGK